MCASSVPFDNRNFFSMCIIVSSTKQRDHLCFWSLDNHSLDKELETREKKPIRSWIRLDLKSRLQFASTSPRIVAEKKRQSLLTYFDFVFEPSKLSIRQQDKLSILANQTNPYTFIIHNLKQFLR